VTRAQQRQRQREYDLWLRAMTMPWTRKEKVFFLVWGLVMIGPLVGMIICDLLLGGR
jgi:hypothetical protein